MRLSIIVPVYNEENTIKKVLEKLVNQTPTVNGFERMNLQKEIIVVDDGSTDGTREILEKFSVPFGPSSGRGQCSAFRVIFQEKNQGKGAAVRRGFQEATGEVLIIQDADLEYDPDEYEKLLQPIIAEETEVVYGSRFLQENPNLYRRYLWGNKLLSFLISFLYPLRKGGAFFLTGFTKRRITDAYTGYKVISKEIYENLNLKSNGFEFEAEITCQLLKKGYKILEVPISYSPRSIEEGKKINYKDAISGFWTIIKNRIC